MADKSIEKLTGLEIAVIGMAGRFPAAKDIDEFWKNLKNGKECITVFSDKELAECGVDSQLIGNPNYVKIKPVLEEKDCFDSFFFGYTPTEAEVMAPHVRIFHECAWSALEDAGYDPLVYEGLIGCYAGSSSSFEWEALSILSGKSQRLGAWASGLMSNKDNLSTHLAYKLDLKGPCFSFFSACSTALAAVHMGSRALLTGECNMALVGGVALDTSGKPGYLYQEGMIFSPDGHCRAFDAKANGTIFGEGVGVVILKRRQDSVAAGDHIYALIKGSAVNNDGVNKVGYTAPGGQGQREVVKQALKIAKVKSESITYVETHGTGTNLGDPVEITALNEAFNTDRRHFCAIGSVKTNIGHLDIAAGIAGFIKTVLSIQHRLIPPSLNFETPNPKIDFENSPFYVNTTLKEWKNDEYPLRAGISSFGIGGTNAHVILEEALIHKAIEDKRQTTDDREFQLIVLSAKTQFALDKMTENLVNYFKSFQNPADPGINFADAVFTLQACRRVFKYRRMAVVSTVEEAIDALSSPGIGKVKTFFACNENQEPPLVFMFPGLGSEYVNMGRDLYEKEPMFREEMNRCFEILKSLVNENIKEILYPGESAREGNRLNEPEITQPLLFMIEYSLAKLLMTWGIKPRAMIGYSFGEYVAACISGVFTLEGALKLVVSRGRLIQKTNPGAMLSVPLPASEVIPLLNMNDELGLTLAIDNGPSCIAAGAIESVDLFEKRLKEKKIMCMRVPVSRAIHSGMMGPILKEFEAVIRSIELKTPQIPYVSNVTGNWIRAEDAIDPGYWCSHLRWTVRFADGLQLIVNKIKNPLFVEVGPGRDLSVLAMRYIEEKTGQRAINLIRNPQRTISDAHFLLDQVGRIWLYGKTPSWKEIYGGRKMRRISLPTYPFERIHYSAEGDPFDLGLKMFSGQASLEKKADMADWFYIPSWKRSMIPSPNIISQGLLGCWLVFEDERGLGSRLVKQFENKKDEVILVRKGDRFSEKSDLDYTIRPGQSEDYDELLSEINRHGKTPAKIIHLWSVTGDSEKELRPDVFDNAQDRGLFSLIFLAKAIGKLDFSGDFEIIAISDNVQVVTGKEQLSPEKSTILSPVKVIPQEYPYIRCRLIDVILPEPCSAHEKKLVERLEIECRMNGSDTVVAYRDEYRWAQTYEPVELREVVGDIPRLRKGGVYLVTGGLGGIGFTLAEYLAESIQAKLILTGRSPFPPREQWDEWIANYGGTDRIGVRIKKIRELETLGAEIMIFGVDVADRKEMKRMIGEVEIRFGPINGVIHAAGLLTGGPSVNIIGNLRKSEFKEQFQAKVFGLMALEEALENRSLDFCLLTSSLSPILGGLGLAAYSAANQFMDSYVYKHNRENPNHWTCLNWGDWQNLDETRRGAGIGLELNRLNILPEEGIETFRRILFHNDSSQIIVSSGDLQLRIDRWVKLKTLREEDDPVKKGIPKLSHRSHLSDTYEAPRNLLEQTLSNIWGRLFGFDQIGIYDDFFELGGDSLKAITLSAKIHKELHVEIPLTELFDRPTIEKLSEYINKKVPGKTGSSDSLIEAVEEREYYPLSSAQKRLYILSQMKQDFVGYNDQVAFLLEGELEMERVEDSFNRLMMRQESLRTSFEIINDEPVQRINSFTNLKFRIEYNDAPPIKAGEIIRNFIRPFDLSIAPLLRVGLIRYAERMYLLFFDMSHIIFDGTSTGILLDEFAAFYAGKDLPEMRIRYKDFSCWQNNLFETGKIKEQLKYWLNLYADSEEIPRLNLPTDYPRPNVMRFEGDMYEFYLEEADTEAFKTLAVDNESTLYMNVMAALNVVLYKYTGQSDIIVGSGIIGRPGSDLQHVIGMFVNTLALRNNLHKEMTYLEFLKEVKASGLKAFENQDVQFEDLVDKLNLDRSSRNPLFDVCLAFQNFEQPQITLNELVFTPYELENKISRFEITLYAWDGSAGLSFKVEYDVGIFKKERIQRFSNHLIRIIKWVCENPDIRVSDIDIVTDEEKQRLLFDFNNTETGFPKDKTIHELYEEQVEKTPDYIAIVCTSIQLSYRELNEKSNRLARWLIEKSVESDTIVGVMMERSIEIIVSIFGILKAGAAYLPIDPIYPQDRIEYMLKDSNARIVVGDRHACPSQPLNFSTSQLLNSASSVAYLIYTSGTTGKPKGVLTTHYNVTHVVKNANYIDLVSSDRILQLSNYAFDGSVFDIFGALLNGSALVMISREDVLSVDRISEIIVREGVTLFFITTALFNIMVDLEIGCFDNVRKVLVGGEQISRKYSEKALDYLGKGRIINVYGPTETTVFATYYIIDSIDNRSVTIPIGKPISNTMVYILDRDLKPASIGISGEVYIGGWGIARGYLNDPEMTAERFPSVKGGAQNPKLYRTGDLARWLEDGNIEFMGRIDTQVKIRGFRIELGEIESHLIKHEKVKDAVVIVSGETTGDKYLCAYIVPIETGVVRIETQELREYLSRLLPEYMIPAYFVTIDKIPLNINGKLNRKALPTPGKQIEEDHIAPRNEEEEFLAEIWSQILGIEKDIIGIDSDFFHLGGHSLKAAIIVAKIRKQFNIDFSLAELFQIPTIRGISSLIRAIHLDENAEINHTEETEEIVL